MLEPAKGGLSSGGVGIWRMGRGGAFEVRGSVTPGIDGIRGGKEMPKGLRLLKPPPAVGLDETNKATWPRRAAEIRLECIAGDQ